MPRAMDSQRTSSGTRRAHATLSPRDGPSEMLSADGTQTKNTAIRYLTAHCQVDPIMPFTSGWELRPDASEPRAATLSMKQTTLRPCKQLPHLIKAAARPTTSKGNICVLRGLSFKATESGTRPASHKVSSSMQGTDPIPAFFSASD